MFFTGGTVQKSEKFNGNGAAKFQMDEIIDRENDF